MAEIRERFRELDRLTVPDLRSEIRSRRPSGRLPGPDRSRLGPAVAGVILAAAGLVLAGRAFLGEPGDSPARAGGSLASAEERIATVAIAALTEAGLHDPSGSYYDYGGVRREEDGWVADFCAPSGVKEECVSESADSFLKIVPEGDDLLVVGAFGAFTDDQSNGLLGHREPAEPPPARWIYGPFAVVDSDESEGRALSAPRYWTGAIPTNVGALCRIQVLDGQGQVAYRSRETLALPPESERSRDGNLLAEIPDDVQASDGRVVCGESLPVQPLPEGPRHVLASGTLNRGEHRGEEWRLVVWRGENVDDPRVLEVWRLNVEGADVYCSGFDVAPLTSWSFGQRVAPGGCSPIQELGEHEAIGSRTSGPVAGEGTHLATGEVSTDVASLELRLTGGEVIEADLLEPPPELGIPRRFFVEFLPLRARGEMVALDDEGEVLATERFGGTGER